MKAIQVSSDILVLGFFQEAAPPKGLAGEADWILNNTLSLLIKSGKVSGKAGEVVLVSSNRTRTPKILWVGLGKRDEFNHAKLTALGLEIFTKLSQLEIKDAYCDLWDITGVQIDFSTALNAFLRGLFQNRKRVFTTLQQVTFHSTDQERVKDLNRHLKELDLRTEHANS